MSNTFTQLYIHVVFAVKYRRAQIPFENRDEIYNYISGIVYRNKCKLLCIGGIANHVHMLIRLSPTISVSALMHSVKVGSSNFIASRSNSSIDFHWQVGYGAFSVSDLQIAAVTDYINHQAEHHLGTSFLDEYRQLLVKNGVPFDPQYIFKDLE